MRMAGQLVDIALLTGATGRVKSNQVTSRLTY